MTIFHKNIGGVNQKYENRVGYLTIFGENFKNTNHNNLVL